jgi:uncharacterized lipoprotein YajG
MKNNSILASLVSVALSTLALSGCDKSSPTATNSPPPTPAKTSDPVTAANNKVTGATKAASDALAAGQAAAASAAQDLGVTVPSFDELRAKASQAINAQNADAEFERLQSEVDGEG